MATFCVVIKRRKAMNKLAEKAGQEIQNESHQLSGEQGVMIEEIHSSETALRQQDGGTVGIGGVI